MKTIIFIFICIVLLSCQRESLTENKNKPNNKLDSLGMAILQSGEHVGFSVAIIHGRDTIYSQGFGHTDTARTNPVTTDNRFLMASVSKLIGSTLVMKLVDEGKTTD